MQRVRSSDGDRLAALLLNPISTVGGGLCSMTVLRPRSELARTAVWLAAGLALVCAAAGATSSKPSTSQSAWRDKYARPIEIPYPEMDSFSRSKLALGRMLFFDPILSGSKSRSCASCHNPSLSWADGQPRAIGEMQQPLPLRSPTLLNVAWTPKLGWDGHFRDLESVAMGPITSPANMNLPRDALVERLAAIPGYVEAFHSAFGDGGITAGKVDMALATFERSIVSTEAPFDRWIDGDETAIDAAAKRGFALFNGKANCAACHSGWAFTDASFHDIGTARGDDIGRGRLFPNSVALKYAFKTPTLRDVARRGPYMHNGSVPTLQDVVELYNRGGIKRPSRDPEIRPLGLSSGEKADLIAFLQTLSGRSQPAVMPELPR
jgi:cytochrome c peroxidase